MKPTPPEGQDQTAAAERPPSPLTERELLDLADDSTQNKYRAAYLEQLRRRACPGCGDGEILG